MCFYTNKNTRTSWTGIFYMVAQRVVFADFVYLSFSYRFCISLFIYLLIDWFIVFFWKGQHFPDLCLQDTDSFRYRDTGSSASANALWLMRSIHRCSTLLRISCPSSSSGLQLSLTHDHAEGHVVSRPSGHTLFPMLSTYPHPLLFLHSDTSQLSGWSVTFREITGNCSISP